MVSALSRRLLYAPVEPGTVLYRVAFFAARSLNGLGALPPDTRIEYIERDDWLLVLTPLAGSSSVRSRAGDVRRFDLRAGHACRGKRVFIMERSYAARMRSFYNKKVRNPTSVAKAVLLARCPPLTHLVTPESFVSYVQRNLHRLDKDKHLYTLEQIRGSLRHDPEAVRMLHIGRDRELLETLLGVELGEVVNSTEDVAMYAEALDLPADAFEHMPEPAR